MMNISRYDASKCVCWNDFVGKAKNSHFFFQRAYMDYHADRFEDHSLMIYNDKGKLIALFPANIRDSVLYSHQGLTFGGLLIDGSMRTEAILDIFNVIKVYCKDQGIGKIIYKCIPHIYHLVPAEEDRYALFRNDAELIRRDVSATIDLSQPVRYSKGRKWTVNKSKKEGFEIVDKPSLEAFWELLKLTIEQQHAAKPVHTLQEMTSLMISFPENIRLFTANREGDIYAGALMYENKGCVHTQYLANSVEGRDLGALDFLLDHLIKNVYVDKKYFDFGISNENGGKVLNSGLMAQKEGFGARAVAHDFYSLDVG